MVDSIKHISPPRLTASNFVVLGQTVSTHIRVPEIMGSVGPVPLSWERSWSPRNTFLLHVLPHQIWSLWVIIASHSTEIQPKNLTHCVRPFKIT